MRRIHFRRTYGNRTRKTTSLNGSNTVTNYVYDALDRLTSETTTQAGVISNRTFYAYDADGNLTLRSRESFGTETEDSGFDLVSASPSVDGFTYNDFGEMTSATVNGVTSTYAYRADGLRRTKTVNGVQTTHLWDGDDESHLGTYIFW